MAMYVMLGRMTQTTRERVGEDHRYISNAAREISGDDGRFIMSYASLGRFDYVLIAEATDDGAAAGMSLDLSNMTQMRIETIPVLRADLLETAGDRASAGQTPENDEAGAMARRETATQPAEGAEAPAERTTG